MHFPIFWCMINFFFLSLLVLPGSVRSFQPKGFRNIFTSSLKAMASGQPQWDPVLGVWVGEKAPGIDIKDFPSPLYVFGYGSLIWKPGPFLEKYESASGIALGYKRLFAQRSYDHRGNPFFPGIVLNLVDDESLIARGYKIGNILPYDKKPENPSDLLNETENMKLSLTDTPETEESASVTDCHGLVWLVPPEDIVPLIEYLDYREKGGYFQTFIQVQLQQPTRHHKINETVTALVYVGHSHNPNFFLPSYDILSGLKEEGKVLFYDFTSRSVVTDIISTAIGPSGPNLEYLFNLHSDLVNRDIHDVYLHNLVKAVRKRIGTWRRRHFHRKLGNTKLRRKNSSPILSTSLFGFGSNEFHQLTRSLSDPDPRVYSDSCFHYSVEISSLLPSATLGFYEDNGELGLEGSNKLIPWEDIENYHVVAGSNTSAFVNNIDHTITIWGKLPQLLLAKHSLPDGEGPRSDRDDSPISIVIEGVQGAAIGYDYIILHLSEEEYNGKIICLGDNQNGQCDAPSTIAISSKQIKLVRTSTTDHIYHLELNQTSNPSNCNLKVLKVSAGLYHAAAITECGGLITWGKEKFGSVLTKESFKNKNEDDLIWYPPTDKNTNNPTKLVDVACGAKHVIVLDDYGNMYSMGDNRYGSLGRTIFAPEREFTLPEDGNNELKTLKNEKKTSLIDNRLEMVEVPSDIRFQRVSCIIN